MPEQQKHSEQIDAEDGQRREQAIDTAQGPGPVLDQNIPEPMPLFHQNERTARDLQSVINPEEFAQLSQRSGEELDQVRPMGDPDDLGVAGRAAQSRPVEQQNSDEQ